MIQVDLKYNDSIESITINDDWNVLTKKQLLFIAKHWQTWKSLVLSNKSLVIAKLQLFLRLISGSKKQISKTVSVINELDGESLYDLAQLTNFVFETQTLIKCPLPVINVLFKKLYAPADGLTNICASEFAFAEVNYFAYHKHNREQDLDLLIATLYRSKDPNYKTTGEIREPFNNKRIEVNLKYVKRLSYIEKQLILLWYMGCRNHIVSLFPSVFSSDNQSSAESDGWLSIIMELSGGKFGTFSQTGVTDLYLLLIELKHISQKKPKTPNQQ